MFINNQKFIIICVFKIFYYQFVVILNFSQFIIIKEFQILIIIPQNINGSLLHLNEKADIWDLGIAAIELATGKTPDRDLVINELTTGTFSLQSITPLFSDFLNCCLKINPEKRQTADQLLQHKFIKQAKDNSLLAIEIAAVMISRNQMYEKIEQMDHSNSNGHKCIKVHFDFEFDEHDVEKQPPKIEEKVVGRFKLKGDHSILEHYEQSIGL